jgi:hypothetical protein
VGARREQPFDRVTSAPTMTSLCHTTTPVCPLISSRSMGCGRDSVVKRVVFDRNAWVLANGLRGIGVPA